MTIPWRRALDCVTIGVTSAPVFGIVASLSEFFRGTYAGDSEGAAFAMIAYCIIALGVVAPVLSIAMWISPATARVRTRPSFTRNIARKAAPFALIGAGVGAVFFQLTADVAVISAIFAAVGAACFSCFTCVILVETDTRNCAE